MYFVIYLLFMLFMRVPLGISLFRLYMYKYIYGSTIYIYIFMYIYVYVYMYNYECGLLTNIYAIWKYNI